MVSVLIQQLDCMSHHLEIAPLLDLFCSCAPVSPTPPPVSSAPPPVSPASDEFPEDDDCPEEPSGEPDELDVDTADTVDTADADPSIL